MGPGCEIDPWWDPGIGHGEAHCSSASFFFRDFWEGAHLELLEVPSGPRRKGGGGLGSNCARAGDQAADHRAGGKAHSSETSRVVTRFSLPHHSCPSAISSGASQAESLGFSSLRSHKGRSLRLV